MRNKFNLSRPVVEWLKYSDYDNKGSISVTELKNPIREIVIKRNMKLLLDTMADVSDYAYMRPGTALHDSFEKISYPGMIPGHDKRLFHTIEGVLISGEFDFMAPTKDFPILNIDSEGLVICDLKFTKMWNLVNLDTIGPDWKYQLSAYRWLASHHGYGFIVSTGIIIAFIADWNQREADRKGIKGNRIQEIPIQLEYAHPIEVEITKKIIELKPYLNVTDIDALPVCTDDEKGKFNGKKCLQYCGARFVCPDSPCAYEV